MRRIAPVFIFVFLAAGLAEAAPLSIVNVAFPGINCKFDTDCTITVNDTSANISLPGTSGTAFLQSRTWPVGQAGTAGAGKYAYLYRLDLRQLTGLTAQPCITQLKLTFGPVAALDYDGNGTLDQVFVGTAGGLGTIAPSSADLTSGVVTFEFKKPVCSGSSPGHGDSSYFFGLASTHAPHAVTATVTPTLGGPLSLNARAPQLIKLPPGGLKPVPPHKQGSAKAPKPKPPGR